MESIFPLPSSTTSTAATTTITTTMIIITAYCLHEARNMSFNVIVSYMVDYFICKWNVRLNHLPRMTMRNFRIKFPGTVFVQRFNRKQNHPPNKICSFQRCCAGDKQKTMFSKHEGENSSIT